jgi:hypothetical protein
MIGIVDFGFMFQRYEVLTNATREGARLAVLPGYNAADVRTRVCLYLQTGGVPMQPSPNVNCATTPTNPVIDVQATTVNVPNGPPIDVMRVQLTYTHNYMFVGPIIALMGGTFSSNLPINTVAIMRTENP